MNEHSKVLGFIKIRNIRFYTICIFLLVCISAKSQQYSLSFSEKNAHEIIEQLESKLQVDFNYDYSLFDQSLIEDFSASGTEDEILSTCFTLLNKDFGLLEEGLYVIKQGEIPLEKQIKAIKYQISLVDDIKTELAFGVASLQGLNINIQSDLKGELTIEGFFSPEQMIQFSYLGYKTLAVPIKELKKAKKNFIVLKEEEHMLDEIVIRDKFLILKMLI